MFKNTSGQKIRVFAFDATTGLPKTGDSANITAYVSLDFGAVTALTDTSATEEDATNARGYYLFDVTQAETNADDVLVSGKSSTSNIVVVGAPARITTLPPNAGALSIDSSGRVDVIKVAGTTQTARDLGGNLDVAVSTRLAPTTAGRTLTCSTGGAARLDWASVESPSSSVTLTNTTVRSFTQTGTGAITSNSYASSALDAIAAAVRDVSNATPAASSLGAGVKAVSDRVPGSGTLAVAADVPTASAVATAVLAAGDVDGFSLEETLKLCLAALAGKISGAATTTITIRSADDAADRVVATVDADGNRTAITLDAT